MYTIEVVDMVVLQQPEILQRIESPFCTGEWLSFLQNNQGGDPVVLKLISDGKCKAYFVGVIVKKAGMKILGSPFDGWLTPDMGFIRLDDIDINIAIESIRMYAFSKLNCSFVQIIDKNISFDQVHHNKAIIEMTRVLHIDNQRSQEDVLSDFSKNGRRDVRASYRKGLTFRQMAFDRYFADIYYDQLIDVFEKQNLKPFYSISKIYDLVEAFKNFYWIWRMGILLRCSKLQRVSEISP